MRPTLRFRAYPALLVAAMVLPACGDPVTDPGGRDSLPPDPPPPAPRVVAQLELVDSLPAAFISRPVPLAVRVLDDSGHAYEGIPVRFAVLTQQGTVTDTLVTADTTGIARTVWTPGPAAGAARLRFQAETLARVLDVRVFDGSFSTASVPSGSGQVEPLGSVLPEPVVLRVVDTAGNPAYGVAVAWSVLRGGGSLVTADSETNAAGEASAVWQLGTADTVQWLQITLHHGSQTMGFRLTAIGFAGIRIRPDLPNARAGRGYDVGLVAAGGVGTTSWSLAAGALPPGIVLDPAGRLTGQPTAPGSFGFTLGARDSLDTGAERAYTLRVCPAPADLAVGATLRVPFPDPCGILLNGSLGREYRVGVMARRFQENAPVAGGLLLQTAFDDGQPITAAPPATAGQTRLAPGPAPAVRAGWPDEHLRRLAEDRERYGQAARRPALGPARTYRPTDPPPQQTFRWTLPGGTDITIPATRRYLGPAVVYYQDDSIAAEGGTVYDDARLAGELGAFEQWGMRIIDSVFGGWGPSGTASTFVDSLGTPLGLPATDLDTNGHLIVLQLRPSLHAGFLGTVRACDRVPRPEHALPGDLICTSSNEGEIVYVAGPGRSLVTHEAKHVSSHGWAFFAGRGMQPGWIEEGTALVASEKASRAAAGLPVSLRAGPAEILPGGQFTTTTQNMWAVVATARRSLAAAPRTSLIGDPVPNPGGSTFYATSWLFHRFLEDAYGPGDGIEPIRRQNTSDTGTTGIATIAGEPFADVLANFMVAIAVDDVPEARAATARIFRGYDLGALADADPYDGFQLGPWPMTVARRAFGPGTWQLPAWYTAPSLFIFGTGTGGDAYLEVLAADGTALAAEHDVIVTVTRAH